MQTRSKNAHQHPGLIVMGPKRRSTKEVRRDKENEAKRSSEEKRTAEKDLRALANLENTLAAKEEEERRNAANPLSSPIENPGRRSQLRIIDSAEPYSDIELNTDTIEMIFPGSPKNLTNTKTGVDSESESESDGKSDAYLPEDEDESESDEPTDVDVAELQDGKTDKAAKKTLGKRRAKPSRGDKRALLNAQRRSLQAVQKPATRTSRAEVLAAVRGDDGGKSRKRKPEGDGRGKTSCVLCLHVFWRRGTHAICPLVLPSPFLSLLSHRAAI